MEEEAPEHPAPAETVVYHPSDLDAPLPQGHFNALGQATFPQTDPVLADSSLAFLDEPQSSNLEFLDLLPYNYADSQPLDPRILQQQQHVLPIDPANPFSLNGGVDLLSGISFEEEPDSTAAHMSKDISDSLQRYWQSQNIEPLEPPESLSSGSASSPESGQNSSHSCSNSVSEHIPTPKAVPSVPCGCLSNLYLALDSLSRLPPDIISAMRVARHSTKVAHDVIKCPCCGEQTLIDNPTAPPPIQCFQSLMCLAALVPSACNAYAAILEMVDGETQRAKAEGRKLHFSYKFVNGMWSVGQHHDQCPNMELFDDKDLDPDTWRTVMRAILRLDVYGFGDPPEDVSSEAFKRQGLRDVVRLLEERSERRHNAMDHAHASGHAPTSNLFLLQQKPYQSVPPDQRNCIRVLEAARIALDNLVIA